MPVGIAIGLIALLGVMGSLGFLAVSSSKGESEQKRRGDSLQETLDSLRQRTGENQKFFEIIRELFLAKTEADREKLIEQLKQIQFSELTTTTLVPRPKSVPSRSDALALQPRIPTTTTTTLPLPTTTLITTSVPCRPPSSEQVCT